MLRIVCEQCGAVLPQARAGRRRRYCGDACRQRAYRARNGEPATFAPHPHAAGEGWALFTGDAGDVVDSLPTASVQSIITSPPYFNLRNYRDHPDQLGQEPTPDQYVERLVNVLDRAARVLRPDGTLWLNIADTYASRANWGASSDRHPGRGHRTGVMPPRIATTSTALKNLLLIPARVALALQAAGWIVRNDIIWHKTNAMPMSVTDRLSNRHEHLFLLTRQPHYRFDLEAIKQPATSRRPAGNRDSAGYANAVGTDAAARRFGNNPASPLASTAYQTRNPGDVWQIATRGTSEDHYAMFPPELPRRCILAATRPGDIVCDPFAGRSTTGRVALELGRRYLGIDINAEDNDAAAQHLANPH